MVLGRTLFLSAAASERCTKKTSTSVTVLGRTAVSRKRMFVDGMALGPGLVLEAWHRDP